MATHLKIDNKLVEKALRAGNHGTKKEAVTAALREYVMRRKQLAILDLFGTIDFDECYSARRSRDLDKTCAYPEKSS